MAGMKEPRRDPRMPDIIGTIEAAEMLGVSRQRVHALLREGKLLGAFIEGHWIIRRTEVQRRIQQRNT